MRIPSPLPPSLPSRLNSSPLLDVSLVCAQMSKQEINDAAGFTRVLEAMQASGKPLVRAEGRGLRVKGCRIQDNVRKAGLARAST